MVVFKETGDLRILWSREERYIYIIDRYFGILLISSKVVDDPGVPGTEDEEEGPVGCQIQHLSSYL